MASFIAVLSAWLTAKIQERKAAKEWASLSRLEKLAVIAARKDSGIICHVVVVDRSGEVKVVKTSKNAKTLKFMRKHQAFMVGGSKKWVAKSVGRGKPQVVAAERCHLVRFSF